MSEPLELAYVEESGPGIPELPSEVQMGGAPVPDMPQVLPGWEEDTVRQFLMGGGAGIHLMIGQGEKDWLMTEADLNRIAPPMTRIMNRWEPALKLSPYADPLLVAHGMALYGWRSALERARAIKDKQLVDERETPARATYAAPDTDGFEEEIFEPEDGALINGVDAPEAMFPSGVRPRS